jgi:hypothetical protein
MKQGIAAEAAREEGLRRNRHHARIMKGPELLEAVLH